MNIWNIERSTLRSLVMITWIKGTSSLFWLSLEVTASCDPYTQDDHINWIELLPSYIPSIWNAWVCVGLLYRYLCAYFLLLYEDRHSRVIGNSRLHLGHLHHVDRKIHFSRIMILINCSNNYLKKTRSEQINKYRNTERVNDLVQVYILWVYKR